MRLAALAERLGLPVVGDGEFRVEGAAPLESAGPGELSFVSSARWQSVLEESRAGAVILPPDMDPRSRPGIRSPNPRYDFARAVGLLYAPPAPAPGVEPGAHVSESARVDPSASVGAGAVVGANSVVGPRSVIHAGALVYPDVVVGADCQLHGGCVVREGTRLGDRVILQPGVILGGDGFGYELDAQGAWFKIPHVGSVVLEDDVEIGAGSTVDRGTYGETRICRGAKIDNLVMIAHNCTVGEGAVIVAQSGLAGSTQVGARAILMAGVGSAGHLRIGDGAFCGARAGLHKDVPPGARVWGAPQMEERSWHRAMAALGRLPDALRRLRAVEKRLAQRDGDGD